MKSAIISVVLFQFCITTSCDASTTNAPSEYAVLERKIDEISIRYDAHEKAHMTAGASYDSQLKNMHTTFNIFVVVISVLVMILGVAVPLIMQILQQKRIEEIKNASDSVRKSMCHVALANARIKLGSNWTDPLTWISYVSALRVSCHTDTKSYFEQAMSDIKSQFKPYENQRPSEIPVSYKLSAEIALEDLKWIIKQKIANNYCEILNEWMSWLQGELKRISNK